MKLPALISAIIFVSVVLCCAQTTGQSGTIKNSFEEDTLLINSHIRISQFFARSNADSAFYYARKALAASQKINYKKGIADAFSSIAYTHLSSYNRNDSADYFYERAFNIYSDLNDADGMGAVCFGMGYVYSFKGNLAKSGESMEASLEYFTQSNNNRGILNCYNSLAYIHEQNKDYNKAYEYINKAINLAEVIQDSAAMAEYYNSLGNIYIDQALITQALDVYFKALRLWESIDDSLGMAIAYGSIGNMYLYQNEFDKALDYFQRKVSISRNANQHWEVSKTYNSIATTYNSKGEQDSALYYFKSALQLNYQMNYNPGIARSFYNLSKTYFLGKEFDTARNYVEMAILHSKNYNMITDLANSHILKGRIFLELGQLNSAYEHIFQGYKIGQEIQSPYLISEGAELLNFIHLTRNEFKDAHEYLKEHYFLQDSIDKSENIKEITRLEMEYQFAKKEQLMLHGQEQEIIIRENKIQQQRLIMLGLGLVITVVVVIAFLIIRNNNIKARFKTIELEQKLLRAQMNPHFVFNSLCAIQSSMLENKTEEAGLLLTKFARLMRTILESSRGEYIHLDKEIETLKSYMDIQKLRFNTDFVYTIDIDPEIDLETYTIPPMLAQPFIENSIEHGLIPKKGKGAIQIRYQLFNGLICLNIEDNGVGRKATSKSSEEHSLATQLTRERILNIKRTVNKTTDLNIIDLIENGNPAGTRVEIKIPYERIL